jgi:hypothetical protein
VIKVNYAMVSTLPSDEFPAPGIIRTPRGANPVNATQTGHRETAPISANATPRVKNPAINVEPWSTSYAQSRSEPKMARKKSGWNRAKRKNKERRMKKS